MSAVDFLEPARESLEDLHGLLRQAALDGRPLPEFVDAALSLIERAQRNIYALSDEEGTE